MFYMTIHEVFTHDIATGIREAPTIHIIIVAHVNGMITM